MGNASKIKVSKFAETVGGMWRLILRCWVCSV